jgi:hypothetical protein
MFNFKSPRLIHFVPEDEGIGADPVEEVDTSVSDESDSGLGGVNPAWKPFENKLDPISFRNIQDELKSMDSEAQKRITSVNSKYEPWKALEANGATPEYVQQALGIVDKMNESPEEIYEALGTYLEREGRLPNKKELKEEVEDNSDNEDSPADDPRFATLEAQNKQMMEFFQKQEETRIQQGADSALETEITGLKSAHAELDEEDVKEVIGRAALIAQQTGKAPTLEQAYTHFAALRDRIRNSPRPGDAAPQLPSLSGGLPASSSQRTLGSLSASEMQNLTAELLGKNK